jgi:hypothetical protein
VIGTGYDIFTDLPTTPILRATNIPTENAGANSPELVRKFVVPRGVIVTLSPNQIEPELPSIVQSQQDNLMLQRTLSPGSLKRLPGAFTLSEGNAKAYAMEKRYNVIASYTHQFNSFDVTLRKQDDAFRTYRDINRDISQAKFHTPEFDAQLFDEVQRADVLRAHYMWEGEPFAVRPLTTLNPSFAIDVRHGLPNCCFGPRHISGDSDFENSMTDSTFKDLPISALTDDDKKRDKNPDDTFVCNGEKPSDPELTYVPPCNELDIEAIHVFIHKYGSHYVHGVRMGGETMSKYELTGASLRQGNEGLAVPAEQVDSIIQTYEQMRQGKRPPRRGSKKLASRHLSRYASVDVGVVDDRATSDAFESGILCSSVDTLGGTLVPASRFYGSRPVEDEERQRSRWIESLNDDPTVVKNYLRPIDDLIVHPDVCRDFVDGYNPGIYTNDNFPDEMRTYPEGSVPKKFKGDNHLGHTHGEFDHTLESVPYDDGHGHTHGAGEHHGHSHGSHGHGHSHGKDESNKEETYGKPKVEAHGHGHSHGKPKVEAHGHGHSLLETGARQSRRVRRRHLPTHSVGSAGNTWTKAWNAAKETYAKSPDGIASQKEEEEQIARRAAKKAKEKEMARTASASLEDIKDAKAKVAAKPAWLTPEWSNPQARAASENPNTYPMEPTIKQVLIKNYLKWAGYKLGKIADLYDRHATLKEDMGRAVNSMTKYKGMFIGMTTASIGQTIHKTERASSSRVSWSTDHFLYNLVDECMADPTDERQKSIIAWGLLYNKYQIEYREKCKDSCAINHEIQKRLFVAGRGDVEAPQEIRNEVSEDEMFTLFNKDSSAFGVMVQLEQRCVEGCGVDAAAVGPKSQFQVRSTAFYRSPSFYLPT